MCNYVWGKAPTLGKIIKLKIKKDILSLGVHFTADKKY